MQFSPLGRTGLSVSRICLGTMMYGSQVSEADAYVQMDHALAAGINFFDTAEVYAIPPTAESYGKTETIIGNWFKARGNRDQVILASKIAGRGEAMGWIRGAPRHTRDQIDAAVEASLKRLQTDYIDLYQLHWPDRRYAGFGFHEFKDYDSDYESFFDILTSLEAHVKAGRIRHIGVSNESAWGVMRFLAESEKHGLPRIASIQNAYSLVSRAFEQGLAEVSLREDVGLLAYSSLAQGYLAGKYRNGAMPAGARKTLFERLWRYEGPGGIEMIDKYVDLAHQFGISPVSMAYRFVDKRPFTTATIIGASSLSQLKDNIAAFDLDWTQELDSAVYKLHQSHPTPCP